MIDKTLSAFDLCRHKNFLPSMQIPYNWKPIRMLVRCVTAITQSFKNANDFLLDFFNFYCLIEIKIWKTGLNQMI